MMTPQEAARLVGQNDPAAPAELTRWVAADHPDRAVAAPVTMEALFVRVDPTHEQPIVVATESGREICRFARPGDAAIFCAPDRKTLPASIMAEWRALHEKAG